MGVVAGCDQGGESAGVAEFHGGQVQDEALARLEGERGERLMEFGCRLSAVGGMLEQFTIAGTDPALNSRTGGHPMNKTAAGK
ncbi:hypothetical protein AB0O86_37645 [Streptomyces hirsutus]